MTCAKFWTEQPSVLLKDAHDFFPFHEGARRCTTTALNSFTRFGIYLGILLTFVTGQWNYILLGVGIAIIASAAFHGMKTKGVIRNEEGFATKAGGTASTYKQVPESDNLIVGSLAADEYVDDIVGSTKRTEPTAANPFMNTLLTEIGGLGSNNSQPPRPPAKNGEFLKRQFSNEFKDRVYGDPSDVYQKTQNQRVWATNPITSVPNDQGSFANWLYRVPGRTCKEGNTRACKSGTEGGQLTYVSMP